MILWKVWVIDILGRRRWWFIMTILGRRWWFVMTILGRRRWWFIMPIFWSLSILFYVISERWSVHGHMVSTMLVLRLSMRMRRMIVKKDRGGRVLVMVMETIDRNHSILWWWRRGRWRRCSRQRGYIIILIHIVHNIVVIVVSTHNIGDLIDRDHLDGRLLGSPPQLLEQLG